jgi:uncharacterized membrane protein
MRFLSDNHKAWLPFYLLTGVFLLLYLATLDRSGYWLDEILTLTDLKKDFLRMLKGRAFNGHGPAYFSMAWLWQRLVGDWEFINRLLPLAIGIAATAIVYSFLLRITDRFTALFAASLLFLNGILIYTFQIIRPYSLALAAVAAILLWIAKSEAEPKTRDVVILAVLSGIAVNAHLQAIFALAAVLIYFLVRPKPVWPLILGILIGLLSATPYLAYLAEHRTVQSFVDWVPEPGFASLFQMPLRLVRLPSEWFGPFSYLISAILFGFTIAGALRLGKFGRLLLLLLAVPVLAQFALGLLYGKDYLSVERYFVIASMAQTVLVAAGALHCFRLKRYPGSFSLIFLTALFSLGTWHLLSNAPHTDSRRIMTTLQRQRGAEEQIVVLTKFPIEFEYYNREKPPLTYVTEVQDINYNLIIPAEGIHILPTTERLHIVLDGRYLSRIWRQKDDLYLQLSGNNFKLQQISRIDGAVIYRVDIPKS